MQTFRNSCLSHNDASRRPHSLAARAVTPRQRRVVVRAEAIANRELPVVSDAPAQFLPELTASHELDILPVILPATASHDTATTTAFASTPSTSSRPSSSGTPVLPSAEQFGSIQSSQRDSHTAMPDGLCNAFDPDAVNPQYNRSGLNGLTAGATSGLDTVSGCRAVLCQLCTINMCIVHHCTMQQDNAAVLH